MPDPTPIILDTDMATDCDDAGALAMLHTLAQRNEARILATLVNNKGSYSAGAVAAINVWYDRPDVAIGAYHGESVGTDAASFFEAIATDTDRYGHELVTRDDAPDAVSVYREALATNEHVVIVSIGHVNNLLALLDSDADDHSQLSGRELIADRVTRLVVMGGEYPSGKEHNFAARNAHEVTQPVIEGWPTEVLLSGYELGVEIQTGPILTSLEEHHPVRRAYAAHPSDPLDDGRPSWDQTAVLAAVRDPSTYFSLSDPGQVVVEDDGANTWVDDPTGQHRYLINQADTDLVKGVIAALMVGLPDTR